MKILKTLLTFGLLFAATASNANDYALVNSYPLLNDMKMAKNEQTLLNNMRQLITNPKNNNKNALKKQQKLFTTITAGLLDGDSKLGLQGTELVLLKNKIKTIQLLWSQEKNILNSAYNNKMYINDAYTTISRISTQLNDLNTLYKLSYEKYKQNSVMKSLVRSYMKDITQTEQMYAMNSVK